MDHEDNRNENFKEGSSGGEVTVARDRFESALLGLMHKNGGESESDEDHHLFTPETHLQISTEILKPPNNNALNKPSRKKRRRKYAEIRDSANDGFHHTFMMRMFDRNVDLSQYSECSPLYPICRAWMINKPLSVENANEHATQNPANAPVDSSEDILEKALNEKSNAINFLPLPIDDQFSVNVPEPLPKQEDKFSKDVKPTRDELLADHAIRWRKIRENWRLASHKADARYQASYNILKNIFDSGMEKECVQNNEEN